MLGAFHRVECGCFSLRLNAGSMAVWDSFDCAETAVIALCCSGGYLVNLAYRTLTLTLTLTLATASISRIKLGPTTLILTFYTKPGPDPDTNPDANPQPHPNPNPNPNPKLVDLAYQTGTNWSRDIVAAVVWSPNPVLTLTLTLT